MSYEMETSDDLGGSGGDQLSEPGTYHCKITEVFPGTSTKGKDIDGFSAMLQVLAGTVKGQEEKPYGLALFNPDMSKDASSQNWSKRKQTAFVVASNVLDLTKLGSGRVSVELEAAQGQQVIITLANEEWNGQTNLRLHYANIFHVDDPRAAKFPKDEAAIKRIDSAFRKKAEYFASILKKKDGAPKSQLSSEQLANL